ncbi:hypothetical protein CDLVIII_1900 [Clostridium sp. DL-VIII]|uniref:DUF3795 domain-containing protein n=1 Tax=Clostridium sp. DL-VIII TaxID=641107 RepID=UPI00023B00B1|nr:DUF3795 domain-containing protein [Clostridium sp. DL-VIII]EHI98586.1 hypothetical protein CDLVIII_1900 [Clostridium sp. DL-VIII]
MNNYDQAVKDLAPCGNDCLRCVYYEKSKVVLLSKELNENLINFEKMAEKIKDFMPIFNYYEQFSAILKHFSSGNCPGCRYSDKPKCQCSINTCHKNENINFCFECSKYPCAPTTYNEELTKTWKENNDAMKKIGAYNFYLTQKEQPRYK